jgi:hypothetical protein
MENKDMIRNEEALKIVKEINDRYSLEKIEEMIKNNFISFSYKEKNYRVRMLNEKDKDDLDLIRRQKFGELLQNSNILFEKEIIKLYKTRGIDIDDLDSQVRKLQQEIKSVQKKLGEALENKESDIILKKYKDDILELTNDIYTVIVKKTNLLENSFERRLIYEVNYAMAYLSVEEKINDKYEKAFLNLDEFLKQDDKFLTDVIYYTTALNGRK